MHYATKTRSLAIDWTDFPYGKYTSASDGCHSILPDCPTRLGHYFKYQAMASTLVQGTYVGEEKLQSSYGGRGTYNPVYHARIQGINRPYNRWVADYRWPVRRCYHASHFWRDPFPSLPPLTLDELSAKVGTPQDSVRARAYASMAPRFGSTVSVLNTLFELKDFRDVAKNLNRGRAFFSDYLDDARSLLSNVADAIKTRPSEVLAMGWLSYALMIKPMIADFFNYVGASLQTAAQSQLAFNEQGKNEQKSHYSEVLYKDSTFGSRGTYGNFYRRSGEMSSAVFTATLGYRYNYAMRSPASAFMRYWGLDGNIEAVWNMIPFSFVVDYFVQVAKALRMTVRDPNVELLPTFYGESVKTTVQRGTFFSGDHRPIHLLVKKDGYQCLSPLAGDDLHVSGIEGTVYTRRPTEPFKGIVVPKLRLPSGRQGATMLALLRVLL